MAYLGPSVNSQTNLVDIDRRYLRNLVVNGAMQISQENGDVAGTTNLYYPVDQFFVGFIGSGGAISTQRITSRTPKNSLNRIRASVTTAKTSLASGDYFTIIQRIEGRMVADANFGSSGAKQLLLTFGFKAPIGTYSFRLANNAGSRSYVGQIVVSNTSDNYYSFIIPGDTTGTWAVDGNIGFDLTIVLATGTTYQGSLGWQAGNYLGTSSNFNGLGSTSNVFELFDVGLYVDETGSGQFPEWKSPEYDEELSKCMRYYQTISLSARAVGASAIPVSAAFYFFKPLRTTPTMSVKTGGLAQNISGSTGTSFATALSNIGGYLAYSSDAAGDTYYLNFIYNVNARM